MSDDDFVELTSVWDRDTSVIRFTFTFQVTA